MFPVYLLGYVLLAATHIMNKVPTKVAKKTTYELWTGQKPYLRHLSIWGCPAYSRKENVSKGYYFTTRSIMYFLIEISVVKGGHLAA